ncbi:Cap15 family cyclic dinucleotide receptor domain-containing protein [Haloplasma contractile]|uniref:Potassium channel domain-containing protein n=1 Tax=Haloplasma contractile SSD-17B TaxID=1033810 RepID=U2FQK6_9MOLU|nr:ion channel [Haloplasma contractile]ERJ13314.1 Potassium channel putative protein [Haloplasma contractile SSD-17B]
MEKYEIKGFDRSKVFVGIAGIALIVYVYFEIILKDSQDQNVKLLFYIISLSLLYWLIFNLFNSLLWKLKIFNIPNLNGKWKGKIISSYSDQSTKTEKECTITIKQTFTKIKIKLQTDTSMSCNVNGFLDITKVDSFQLSYEYENQANGNSTETMNDHKGYCIVDFEPEDNSIIGFGNYFNDIKNRKSFGYIEKIRPFEEKTFNKNFNVNEELNVKKIFSFVTWFLLIFSIINYFYNNCDVIPLIFEGLLSITFSTIIVNLSPLKMIKTIFKETLSLLSNNIKEKFTKQNNSISTIKNYAIGLYTIAYIIGILSFNGLFIYVAFNNLNSENSLPFVYSSIMLGLLIINTFLVTLSWFVFVLPNKLENKLGSRGAIPIVISLLLILLSSFSIIKNPDNTYYDLMLYSLVIGFIILFLGNIIFLFKDINIFLYRNKNKQISIIKYFLFMFIYIIFYATYVTYILHKFDASALSTVNSEISTIDYFYYTVITITTVGYGDVTLNTFMGKIWSMILSLQGFIYFALLLGILSSYIMNNASDNDQKKE